MPLTVPRAFQIGRFLGVPVYLTWTWLLFVAVIVPLYTGLVRRFVPTLGAAVALSLALALIWGISVLLHEFGHVVAAQRQGAGVVRVELGFLGGETLIQSREQSATSEFWIAASGPLVSLLLGAPGLIGLLTGGGFSLGLSGVGGLFLSAVTIANLAIAAFNLLPGIPLDGGHIAAALLWRGRRDRIAATRIAAYGGYLVAALLALVAIALVLSAGDRLGARIPLMLALVMMSAVLWSEARSAVRRADRERTLSAAGIAELIDAVDAVPSTISIGEARRDTTSELVIVHGGAHGPAYVDRAELDAAPDGPLTAISRSVPPEQLITETATRLDLVHRMRESAHEWYVVVARDGLPIGIVGASRIPHRETSP